MSLEGESRAGKNRAKFANRDRVRVTSGRYAGRAGTVLGKERGVHGFAYEVKLDDLSDLVQIVEPALEYIRSGGA